MSGQFEVVTAELTGAADKIRNAVAPVSCYSLSSAGASATAFGHDQLAEVFETFCAKASEVVSATATGDEAAAGELDASAASYDGVDSGTGNLLGGFYRTPTQPTFYPVTGSR